MLSNTERRYGRFRRWAVVALFCVVFCGAGHGQGVAPSMQVSRLEKVSGDRQIVVNATMPPSPYVVRALDKNGNPVPGALILIGPTTDPGGPWLYDEFHFLGFNDVDIAAYTSALGYPSIA